MFLLDIEAQIREIQSRKKEVVKDADGTDGVGLLESGFFDTDLYDGGRTKSNKFDGYLESINPNDEADEDEDEGMPATNVKRSTGFGAPAAFIEEIARVNQNFYTNT